MDFERALTPPLRETLRDLLRLAAEQGLPEPMLVGATALRTYIPDDARLVASREADLAACVSSWAALDAMIAAGSAPAPVFDRRKADDLMLIHERTGTPVDLVPFGPLEDPVGRVPLRVPTLASLLILKLVAWNDRRAPKDLSDVGRIVRALEPTGDDPLEDGEFMEHMIARTLHLGDTTLWFTGRGLARTLRPATRDAVRAIVAELRDAPFATRAPMRQLAPTEDDPDERDAWVLHQLDVLWLALALN